MKNWIRLYFRRNYASFNAIGSLCHNYPHNVSISHDKLYHKTPRSSCTNRQSTELTRQCQSDLKVKDVPITEVLSDLNSRLVEPTDADSIDEVLKETDVLFKFSQCALRLSQFTDSQLLEFMDTLMTHLKLTSDFHKHKSIKRLIQLLDDECHARASTMNLQTVLPMMEKFSCLTKKHSNFLFNVVHRHSRKFHLQPIDNFFKIVEIVNKHKYWQRTKAKPYELEYYLEQNFNKLNIEQISTITCALIQLNKSIVSFELKKKLFLYVVDNLDTMSHRNLYKFLNLFCLKESFTINMTTFTPEFLRLLETFDEKFDTFSLRCIGVVSLLTTKFLVHKPEFLEKLYQRFLREGGTASKRTIDCIVYTLFFFHHRSGDDAAYSKILQIITTDSLKPFYKHTKRYIRLISWFCNVGIYDRDIIDEILDEEYLSKTYDKLTRFSMYPYPLVIDTSLQIECPDYTGHRLSPTLRNDLLRCYNWDLMNCHSLMDCHTDPYQLTDDTEQFDCKDGKDLLYCDILKEMGSKLNTLSDEEITYVGYVLPHMPRPNLLFCLDENKRPRNLEYLKETPFVKWNELDFQYKWYAVTVLIRNTFLSDAQAVPLGIEVTKIRHLRKLKFHVITVVQDEWKSMSEEQKIKLCTDLIQ